MTELVGEMMKGMFSFSTLFLASLNEFQAHVCTLPSFLRPRAARQVIGTVVGSLKMIETLSSSIEDGGCPGCVNVHVVDAAGKTFTRDFVSGASASSFREISKLAGTKRE